jgi:hypothetical protein
VKKVANLAGVRRKLAGNLPQWSELEGKADELLKNKT